MKRDGSLTHQGWLQAKQATNTRKQKFIEDAIMCNLCIGSTWNEGTTVQGTLQTQRGEKQEWFWRSFLSKQTNRSRRRGEVIRLLQSRGCSDITLGIMAVSSTTCHSSAWCLPITMWCLIRCYVLQGSQHSRESSHSVGRRF